VFLCFLAGFNSSTFYACNFTPVLPGGLRKKICDTNPVGGGDKKGK